MRVAVRWCSAKSPSGVVLAGWVYVVYRLACMFEGYVFARGRVRGARANLVVGKRLHKKCVVCDANVMYRIYEHAYAE